MLVDQQQNNDFYNTLRKHYQNDVRSLGRNSAESQGLRFRSLERLFSTQKGHPFSLLDVGCGFGDFFGFLQQRSYHEITYTGIEVNKNFFVQAQQKYPQASFIYGDFDDTPIGDYDYIIANGVLSYHTKQKAKYFDRIQKMYTHAKKGSALTFLDEKFHPKDELFLPRNPDDILKHCRKYLTPHATIKQDYLYYDFTLFLPKS